MTTIQSINHKQSILTNSDQLISAINSSLTSNQSDFIITEINSVAHGKGTRKDMLEVAIGKKGEWTAMVRFNTITGKYVNIKLLGKYSKDDTHSISIDAWCIFNKVEAAIKSFIADQTTVEELSATTEPTQSNEAMVTVQTTEAVITTTEEVTTQSNQSESFNLYTNTYTTYSEAYDKAITNDYPTTMILSSNHPTMTNERLQQLEYEYTFSKQRMNYNDMKEYYLYLSELPSSLDQEERYYKLKSLIQRYESQQQSIKQREEEVAGNALEASRLLLFMKEHGLDSISNKDYQSYHYKGNKVYMQTSMQTTDQYYNKLLDIFNEYFAEYKDEYNSSMVYYYQGSTDTNINPDNYPYGWISYNPGTLIAAFNRPLANQELSAYGLMNNVNINS